MEIQNQGEGYLYRGEVESIAVESNELRVRFAWLAKWLAKGDGFPPLPNKWVKDDCLDYAASFQIYSVSGIGPGTDGDSRLCLQSPIVGEIVVLHPTNGNKLDPSIVEGL